jgi:hypothetical protein
MIFSSWGLYLKNGRPKETDDAAAENTNREGDPKDFDPRSKIKKNDPTA